MHKRAVYSLDDAGAHEETLAKGPHGTASKFKHDFSKSLYTWIIHDTIQRRFRLFWSCGSGGCSNICGEWAVCEWQRKGEKAQGQSCCPCCRTRTHWLPHTFALALEACVGMTWAHSGTLHTGNLRWAARLKGTAANGSLASRTSRPPASRPNFDASLSAAAPTPVAAHAPSRVCARKESQTLCNDHVRVVQRTCKGGRRSPSSCTLYTHTLALLSATLPRQPLQPNSECTFCKVRIGSCETATPAHSEYAYTHMRSQGHARPRSALRPGFPLRPREAKQSAYELYHARPISRSHEPNKKGVQLATGTSPIGQRNECKSSKE